MTQTKLDQANEAFLQELISFADLLFREVLTQRCDPEGMFYLPGLPVTNRELLTALVERRYKAEATRQLKDAWNQLFLTIFSEGEKDLRLPRICQIYQLNEMEILTLVLTFVQQLDPKYEKAILVLQGDSGRRVLDSFLLKALAVQFQWRKKFRIAQELKLLQLFLQRFRLLRFSQQFEALARLLAHLLYFLLYFQQKL